VEDLAAIDRELDVARECDDNGARARLISRALALPEAQPFLAEYLDELAYAYQELGRFDEAIDAMRRAVTAGWDGELDDHPSAEALIADLLLRAGRPGEADEAWLRAERQTPRDPSLHHAAARAYTREGSHGKALPWQTKGLELALAGGEYEGERAWLLTGERAETLSVLGRAPDELQLRAEEVIDRQEQQEHRDEAAFFRGLDEAPAVPPRQVHAGAGVAWFPSGQYERALQMWPSFAEDYEHGPYAAYCARLELLLRELRSQGTVRLALAPVAIDEYLSWCAERGRDPEQSGNRADYATELPGSGVVQPWPPRRNESCWCGSGSKYKKCCQRAG
jgi:tetratricopeptide (TPR) repeat protein